MRQRMSRRGALTGFGASLFLIATGTGCGGSADDGGGGGPSVTTRSRVRSLHDLAVRGVMQSGFQNADLAIARNGLGTGAAEDGAVGSIGGGSGGVPGAYGGSSTVGTPLIGAFLRNTALARQPSRSRQAVVEEGGGAAPAPGGDGDPVPDIGPYPWPPSPSFYYDYYLGLWVATSYTAHSSLYALFEDEGKTKPAGSIETSEPASWDAYPQVFRSLYSFTAGYLAGSRGNSENTLNENGSGRSSYENVYADGWSDHGASSWTSAGDFTWTSRNEGPNAVWNRGNGSFRADGSGGTRYETSEGYRSNYTYMSDGSGRGRIEGPDAGLPVTITWDAYGNTTIRYADGTVETIRGWGGYYGGGYGYGDGGVTVSSEP